jgi:hypothetical protein
VGLLAALLLLLQGRRMLAGLKVGLLLLLQWLRWR